MKWYTAPETGAELTRLRGAWPDAPTNNLEVLNLILGVAKEQVIEGAPAPAAGTSPTADPLDRYVLAQLRQAQELWKAGTVDAQGQEGEGAFVYTPRPLSKIIRGIIRPPRNRPRVF